MNTIVFTAAKNFLHQKLQIRSSAELFQHLINSPALFSQEQLKKDSNEFLLYKMIFIAGVLERRNFGAIVKEYTRNSLIQLKCQMDDLEVSTLVQLFLVLGNVLLYDEQIVSNLLVQLKENEREVSYKQAYSIFHSLYKIGLQDKFWEKKAFHAMTNNVQNIGVQDYVQYMHIASNLYQLGKFEESYIMTLLEILIFKLGKQYKHIYQSKFSYQFAQMMFNLYPEIIDQSIGREECSSQNIFSKHYNSLRRDYLICRQILRKKYAGSSLDYFENDHFPNIFRLREDNILKAQSEFEKEVSRALDLIKVKYSAQEQMLIYDTDFFVENKLIINCNGPLHFISTLENEVKSKSLNSYMQIRHLKGLKGFQVLELDFNQWNQPATKEIIAKDIKIHLNII